jgi:hypothetical protein
MTESLVLDNSGVADTLILAEDTVGKRVTFLAPCPAGRAPCAGSGHFVTGVPVLLDVVHGFSRWSESGLEYTCMRMALVRDPLNQGAVDGVRLFNG